MTRTGLFRRGRKAVSAMQLDTERYRHHLTEYEMSEEEQVRLMEQVWTICHSFMVRETGRSPEQLLQRIRSLESCISCDDAVDSSDPISSTFNNAALGEATGKSRP